MNKRNKIFALSSSCLMLFGLVSCGEITATEKEHVLVEFSGDNEVVVTADDVFNKYLTTKDGVEAAYNQITDAVARHTVYDSTSGVSEGKRQELIAEAKADVDDVKSEAENNATANKTNYEDELDKLLKNNNAEDLDQLQIIFENKKFRTYLDEKFYEDFLDELKEGGNIEIVKGETTDSIQVDSYLNDILPYHVKHILVNVSASSSNYTTSTIKSSEAVKLANTINSLGLNTDKSFGKKAAELSDDPGSAADYGDLGLMSINTSYVNEFKLGIYAYDTLFNTSITKDEKVNNKLNKFLLNNNEEEASIKKYNEFLKTNGLNFIPSGIADKLIQYKDVDLDTNNEKVNDGKEQYYPINILWNEYLNKHQVSFVEYADLDFVNPDTVPSDPAEKEAFYRDNSNYVKVTSKATSLDENGWVPGTNYKSFDFNVNGAVESHVILTDGNKEDPKPLLVTRAGTGEGESGYQGVHFIAVERNPLVEEQNGIKLSDYYTTKLPDINGHIDNENIPEGARVYVNAFDDTQKAYQSRVDKLIKEIHEADNSIDKKINEYYFKKSGAEIKDAKLKKYIEIYKDADEEADDEKSHSELASKWKEYVNMLNRQLDEQSSEKMIPMVCAINFENASTTAKDLFEIGGVCHYVEQKA